MLATTLIYLSGLALCMAAGVAITALVTPQGRWLTPAAPAAGAACIVVLAHVFGFFLAGATAVVLALVVVAALLGVGLWRRDSPLRAAIALSRGELLALVLGAVVGMLFLLPVLSIGFPTVLAANIADGWARSVLSKWLLHNSLMDSATSIGADRPVGSYSTFPHELGAGYEYLIALVSTVTGKATYQTALPVAALAGPISVGGWCALQARVTQRRTELWQALVLAAATLTPVFVMPYVDNYLTQFLSLSLWPFAMAALYVFLREPSVWTAVLAAVGLGATAAVYPPLAPWFAPPALLLLLVGVRSTPGAILRRALWLGAALLVLVPVVLVRAYEAVVLFSGVLGSNAALPALPGRAGPRDRARRRVAVLVLPVRHRHHDRRAHAGDRAAGRGGRARDRRGVDDGARGAARGDDAGHRRRRHHAARLPQVQARRPLRLRHLQGA